jgi:hypothetical protein
MKKATSNEVFDFRTIKTPEDAFKKKGYDYSTLPDVSTFPEEYRFTILNLFILIVVIAAINNGWKVDHCNKRSLSASSMSKHEKHCTKNPDRECRLCHEPWDIRKIVAELNKTYKIVEKDYGDLIPNITQEVQWVDKPVTIEEIFNLVNGCPMCAFSVWRQSGFAEWFMPEELRFDLKKEMEKYWAKKNQEEFERERREMAGGNY